MLQVKAPDVGPPEQTEIGFSLTMPPQPQNPRFSPPLAAGQPLDLYQHKRPDHDGQRPAATTAFVGLDFGVQGCKFAQARTRTAP